MYDERLEAIMGRSHVREKIVAALADADAPAIFVQGDSGSGKTSFVRDILARNGYHAMYYDLCNYHRSMLDDIDNNLSEYNNVLHMFAKTKPRTVIVLDGVEAMNCIDRSSINSVIQIIRRRNAKKQRINHLICIGSNHVDKGISDLTKLCAVVRLQRPSDAEQRDIVGLYAESAAARDDIATVARNDLRKTYMYIEFMRRLVDVRSIKPCTLCMSVRDIICSLCSNDYGCPRFLNLTNETNRTIISLIWYENLVDLIDGAAYVARYLACLDNICMGDYIDRVIFQKQVWQLNEPSFCIKVIAVREMIKDCLRPIGDVRFTKVLTKYSNEYNNLQFVISLCDKLGLDRCDMLFYMSTRNPDYRRHGITDVEYRRIARFLMKKNSGRANDAVVALDDAESEM